MPYPQIKASLIQLLDAIKRADAPQITSAMERLEQIAAEQRGNLHPQLAHFLDRRSYAKALAFVEAQETA